MNKIACFLTCGYTESGAMQQFLKRINPYYDYKQYLPNKTIKKKGTPKTISSEISGLTGDALYEKVYEIISKHKSEILECKAILIEDDTDNSSYEEIQSRIATVKEKISLIIGSDISVLFLFAVPEIEIWFVADWENGFESLYLSSRIVKDIKDNNIRKFFTVNLHKYINCVLLSDYLDDIEKYGYQNDKYEKFSDKIIDVIQKDIKEYINALSNANRDYSQLINGSRCLYYSKRLHGDYMLRNIIPENVSRKCIRFFNQQYMVLKEF